MPLQPKHPSQSSSQCAIDSNNTSDLSDFHSSDTPSNRRQTVPQSLVSPAFTPPSTPTPSSVLQPSLLLNTDTQHSDLRPSLLQNLPRVECVVRARIPTTSGSEIFLHLYKNDIDNKEHLAIVFGNDLRSKSLDFPREGETEMDRMIRGAYIGRLYPGRTTSMSMNVGLNKQGSTTAATSTDPPQPITTTSKPAPLVRIHSECYTGETAWSARCDCGEQLDEAARLMSIEGAGIVVYLRQEGRGIGLSEKLKAYNLQDLGNDTVTANLLLRHPADARSYGLATAILQDFNLSTIRLLTNNPEKVIAVEGPNQEILVTERVPMIPLAWKGLKGGVTGREVGEYLKTKANAPDPIRPWRGFPTDFENPDTTHGPSASRPWGGLIASVLFCELMILVFL